jgi:L-ascorbate metabolism protein UlaG (beta-lactamase superfamily)
MDIKWLGHSCFMMTDKSGTRILTDPYDPSIGKELEPVEADIVTISHEHHDHSYLHAIKNKPEIVNKVGEFNINGIRIRGFLTKHDDKDGALRGENRMYLFYIDGMRVLHAGDLGAIPPQSTLNDIGEIDVLLVPIGGTYTINSLQALELANLLKPKVVIPMHYKTKNFMPMLDGVDNFLRQSKNCRIHRLNESLATLEPDYLGEDRILVLSVD